MRVLGLQENPDPDFKSWNYKGRNRRSLPFQVPTVFVGIPKAPIFPCSVVKIRYIVDSLKSSGCHPTVGFF